MMYMANESEKNVREKLAAFFIIFIILTGFTLQDEPLTDLQRRYLKGKVKSVMETRTNEVVNEDGSVSKEITYKKFSLYNEDGFETETTIYNTNGKSSKLYFLYDTAKFNVGFKEFSEEGTLWLTVTYIVDKDGNKEIALYDWLERGGYDEIREKSEQLYEVLNRNPWDKVLYVNDYRGYHLEEEYLKADETLLFKFTYRYDIFGNKTEMIYFNAKGRTSWETKYKYDRKNNMVESTVYKSNRVAAISKYSYQFDSTGNWTSRTEKREVKRNILTSNLLEGKFTIERTIEYYPN